MDKYRLKVLPQRLAVCRLNSGTSLPASVAERGEFYSLTETGDEASLVCPEELAPGDCPAEKGFRALRIEGPLDFSLTGILSSLLTPLAEAGLPVFTVSTFDTDYILVKEDNLNSALSALSAVAVRTG